MLRKFFFVLSLLLLLSTGTAQAEDRRTDKTKLVIMTFNGEFLWDGISPEEGQADFP